VASYILHPLRLSLHTICSFSTVQGYFQTWTQFGLPGCCESVEKSPIESSSRQNVFGRDDLWWEYESCRGRHRPYRSTLDQPNAITVTKPDAATVTEETVPPNVKVIKLSIADVNPFPQVAQVAKRKNNIVMYFPSGTHSLHLDRMCESWPENVALLFALSYSISYTCSTTLFAPPYEYDALKVGLVLLSFGVGEPFCAGSTDLSA
jgi:hypothetical protein